MGNSAYNKQNTKTYLIRLNLFTDQDLIAKLESMPSKQGYVKSLIRKDIQEERAQIITPEKDEEGNVLYIQDQKPVTYSL